MRDDWRWGGWGGPESLHLEGFGVVGHGRNGRMNMNVIFNIMGVGWLLELIHLINMSTLIDVMKLDNTWTNVNLGHWKGSGFFVIETCKEGIGETRNNPVKRHPPSGDVKYVISAGSNHIKPNHQQQHHRPSLPSLKSTISHQDHVSKEDDSKETRDDISKETYPVELKVVQSHDQHVGDFEVEESACLCNVKGNLGEEMLDVVKGGGVADVLKIVDP